MTDESSDSIHVLLVDDEPDFVEMAAEFLERQADQLVVDTSTAASDGLERISATDIDCIVSDFDMPGLNGIEFLKAVRKNHADLPFILFTGKGSEEVASEAISEGVTDYLQKESGTVQYELLYNRIEHAHEEFISKREIERMNIAIETVDAGIAFLDETGQFLYVNPAYAEHFGYNTEELSGEHIDTLYPDEQQNQVYDEILPTVPQDGEWSGKSAHLTKDGRRVSVSQTFSYCSAGMLLCFVSDVTDENETDGERKSISEA